MKSSKLERCFDRFNKKYFGNKLPKAYVYLDKRIWKRDCVLGDYTEFDTFNPKNKKTGQWYRIRIANEVKKVSPRMARFVLLHEMVHHKLNRKKEYTHHGPLFQKEMLRLARAGAFNSLW